MLLVVEPYRRGVARGPRPSSPSWRSAQRRASSEQTQAQAQNNLRTTVLRTSFFGIFSLGCAALIASSSSLPFRFVCCTQARLLRTKERRKEGPRACFCAGVGAGVCAARALAERASLLALSPPLDVARVSPIRTTILAVLDAEFGSFALGGFPVLPMPRNGESGVTTLGQLTISFKEKRPKGAPQKKAVGQLGLYLANSCWLRSRAKSRCRAANRAACGTASV